MEPRVVRGLREATGRNSAGAEPYIPTTKSLRRLSAAVQDCRGCDLYRGATQAVFGRGPRDAGLMLVGEQPGHAEDLEGAPFVGPAGELLDRALERAGIDRAAVYVTNVVKHFKYVREGKRRIHKTPNQGEIEACRPWLFREIALVDPSVLVCLGATAARAMLGPGFRLLKERGRFVPSTLSPRILATIHPSAVLRARDDERTRMFGLLAADLSVAFAGLETVRR